MFSPLTFRQTLICWFVASSGHSECHSLFQAMFVDIRSTCRLSCGPTSVASSACYAERYAYCSTSWSSSLTWQREVEELRTLAVLASAVVGAVASEVMLVAMLAAVLVWQALKEEQEPPLKFSPRCPRCLSKTLRVSSSVRREAANLQGFWPKEQLVERDGKLFQHQMDSRQVQGSDLHQGHLGNEWPNMLSSAMPCPGLSQATGLGPISVVPSQGQLLWGVGAKPRDRDPLDLWTLLSSDHRFAASQISRPSPQLAMHETQLARRMDVLPNLKPPWGARLFEDHTLLETAKWKPGFHWQSSAQCFTCFWQDRTRRKH